MKRHIDALEKTSAAERAVSGLYKSFSGDEVEYNGIKYLLIQYADILAKVVETDKI